MIASVITDYKASKAEIVDVDFAEFQCNPGNLRIAFRCAISLLHLCDWVARKPAIDANFKFKFKKGAQTNAIKDEKMLVNALADLNADLELIRGVANSVNTCNSNLTLAPAHIHCPMCFLDSIGPLSAPLTTQTKTLNPLA